MPKTYKIVENGLHHQFLNCRRKIQLLGGGFGNGKTSAVCNKALMIAKDYPGANILIARSTYPKLNDTIRKAFIDDWCPKDWVKRRPTKDDNTLILKNGTTFNFRYIAQRGKTSEDGTTSSNLLSANYDLIVVDQIEDPEIAYKDFTDLMGRLRGNARYIGEDPSMPRTGPRQMLLTANPSMNWVYKKLVKPFEVYRDTNQITEDLIIDLSTGEPMIELLEGSTYENKHNLEPDYIVGLEATYKGQMRERYLMGKWAAFEGLVYPSFDQRIHVVPHEEMIEYLRRRTAELRYNFFSMLRPIESYDYGLASPSCYLHGSLDPDGILFIYDGFYVPEATVKWQAEEIERIRFNYSALYTVQGQFQYPKPFADPSIFRRTSNIGETIARRFELAGVSMQRAMNSHAAGISKVTELLAADEYLTNPFTGLIGSPRVFYSDRLTYLVDEKSAYYWKKNPQGDRTDVPIDKDDHSQDAERYMVTRIPPVQELRARRSLTPEYLQWREAEDDKGRRYG